MKKKMLYGEDAREKMFAGIEKVAKAVQSTLGPKGRLVVLDNNYGNPLITKDGVSVAREIELEDPYENIGARILKEVASKTNDDAGDGTSTSTTLAYSMAKLGFEKIKKENVAPIDIKKGMDKAAEDVVAEIKKMSKKVSGSYLEDVATISANNDRELGKIVADAFRKVGEDGVITVENSSTMDTTVEYVEGMQFERGYLSPYFALDKEKMETEFKDARILLYNGSVSTMQKIVNVLNMVAQENKPLLIICDNLEGEALGGLAVNVLQGRIKAVAVKAPSLGQSRENILDDIAALVGGKVIRESMGDNLENIKSDDLGLAKSVKVTKDSTTIIGNDSKALEDRINEIKKQIENSTDENDKKSLRVRLSKLSGGAAIIKIGASTEIELKEKKQRMEDTLSATRAALKEGVVPGGGLTLFTIGNHLVNNIVDKELEPGYDVVIQSLKSPAQTIFENAVGKDKEYTYTLNELDNGVGFNAKTCKKENLMKAGVIDPAKVTRTALQNAVSVVGMLLTTECVIINAEEENKISIPQSVI